jgi:hypothetical protein
MGRGVTGWSFFTFDSDTVALHVDEESDIFLNLDRRLASN